MWCSGRIAERGDLLVQPGADPRHLRLRDARPDPERGDEVVDCPGRHPVHPGLHHHRIQGLVDPPSAFEDDREERALPQLRDPQLHIPGLGRDQPRPGPVPFGDTGSAAFIAAGADDLGGLGLDQLLHDQPDRLADQIHALPGTERLQQLGCDRLRQRHRWEPPDEYLPVHIENPADGALNLDDSPNPETPPRQGTHTAVGQAGGVLLVETVRISGIDRGLSTALAAWRKPLFGGSPPTRPFLGSSTPSPVTPDRAVAAAQESTWQLGKSADVNARNSGHSDGYSFPPGGNCDPPTKK